MQMESKQESEFRTRCNDTHFATLSESTYKCEQLRERRIAEVERLARQMISFYNVQEANLSKE